MDSNETEIEGVSMYMKEIMKKHRLRKTAAILCYTIYAAIETYFALVLGDVVDYASKGQMTAMLTSVTIAVLLLAGSLLFTWVGLRFRTSYVANVIEELKKKLMESIYNRGLMKFSNQSDSYYLNILSNDMDIIERDYLMPETLQLYYVASFLLSAAALFYISWKALLFFVVLFLLPMFIPQLFSRILAKLKKSESEKNEEYTFAIKEQIMGMSDIVMNLSVKSFLHKFSEINHIQQQAKKNSTLISKFVNEVSSVVSFMAQLGCMAVGGVLVIRQEITVGQLIAAVQLLNSIFNPMNALAQIRTSMNGTADIRRKLENEYDEPAAPDHKIKVTAKCDINCKDLNIWYKENTPVIKNFSFAFSSRGVYAVIGESGSGKTTLMKCLLKKHDQFSGNITIGNRDIRDLTPNEVYRHVGYVPQNVYLFNDTLEKNITLGEDFSKEEILTVIEQMNLNKVLNEHDGELGDSGNKISGGEKQRIAIARVLIRQPEIIIFDEPTAALDPETRDAINELIFGLKEYTRIVITHDQRKEYIEKFDSCISIS